MRNLLVVLIFSLITWAANAQLVPFSQPYSQFDYYIEKRAEEMYQARIKSEEDPSYDQVEYDESSEPEVISIGEEPEDTEVIICFYDANRNYDCATVNGKE